MTVEHVAGIAGGDLLAGEMDRETRTILISTRFSFESQRFTLAHELGHVLLHPGSKYFRDRAMEAPDFFNPRPYYEVEADAFAAELLMPKKYLEKAFYTRFQAPLDTTAADPDVTRIIRQAHHKSSLSDSLQMPELDRARAFASAVAFRSRAFVPLYREFTVSKTAMAIQLVQSGLIK